ncbi:hypothetical protein K2173_013914 [Erythroxylum novogranatense]|uniref:ARM repeat superfamily protein n=1 Tax=Erythroxylum novogranatense TaxID=1862640 RepID=A0AAV8SD75_9ROSI|nr:hypothetical protein K2173_013914 [Erythroxylum novogranatense]
MALDVKPNPGGEGEGEGEGGAIDAPAHHPSPPPDELFDVSTTVDPSYVISLIRKLIPIDTGSKSNHDKMSNSSRMEASELPPSGEESGPNNMDINQSSCQSEDGDLLGEYDIWEEHGCVLWDLASSPTHALLMVQNLVLEVLLANLKVSQSARVTEICLGIIANLGCHDVPMKRIVSTEGMIELIVDQLFLDDTQCLCEVCRLLSLGLQGSESNTWAKALLSEHILGRLMWIAENTLNAQLSEKILGLLLAILESQAEVSCHLLSTLMGLGLPSLLMNLLAFEMKNLTGERVSQRYSVFDVILRAIEALSTLEGHSQEICSNRELFNIVCELVKLPDKVEVASSCVTAAVLLANVLSDVPDLTYDISQDLPFLEGLLDILSFASDDLEARSALWSIMARLFVRIKENEMNLSTLHQFVLVLLAKSDLIEEDLLDRQLDNLSGESNNSSSSTSKLNARDIAIQRIINILNQWTTSKDSLEQGRERIAEEFHVDDVNVRRLLDCCCKHIRSTVADI